MNKRLLKPVTTNKSRTAMNGGNPTPESAPAFPVPVSSCGTRECSCVETNCVTTVIFKLARNSQVLRLLMMSKWVVGCLCSS